MSRAVVRVGQDKIVRLGQQVGVDGGEQSLGFFGRHGSFAIFLNHSKAS